MEPVGRQPRRNAVIGDKAILFQEQPITAAARLKRFPGVGIHAVQEFGGIGANDFDLAQGRRIKNADRRPYRNAFAVHRRVHVLTHFGKITRAPPLCDQFKHSAIFGSPAIDIGRPCRLEQCALCMTRERTESLRRIWRTKACQTNIGHRLGKCC